VVCQTSVGESDYQRFNQRDLRHHHGFRSAWREALRGGGVGVFVALIPPEQRKQLEHAVAPLSVIPIDIDVDGTCLIYPSLKS